MSAKPKVLICTVGLPRSGKTTWVHGAMNGLNAAVINPDSIRLALHGQRFWGPAEPRVWAQAKEMLTSLFLAGHDCVIVDATNITQKRRDMWKFNMFNDPKEIFWNTFFKLFTTTEEECIKRAAGDNELIEVIKCMANQFEQLTVDERPW